MTVLGFWVVVVALFASVAATVQYYRNTAGGPTVRSARRWVVVSALGISFASLLLLMLLLLHDFTNGYVYSYSSRDLPLHFLISSFYAGQEGSFLFWALCSVAISLLLMKYTARSKHEPWVMSVFMGAQAFLLLLLAVKTPFTYLWEMFPGAGVNMVPPDGRGLNPLLQNFWMVIHPPVLFVGFAAMAVPFSYAVAGLWKKEYAILAGNGFAWVLFATLVLGLGIMLGAYWAYGVLGWGGYWGWDPVENSSLVPWITGMALVHTLLAQKKNGSFVRTNFFLAIISFFLVVYSTFLTRSGILGDSSVHSFTDPGTTVYSLMLLFLASILLAGLGMMYLRRKDLVRARVETVSLSREMMLGIGTLALVLTGTVVLFGTSLPIFSRSTVDPSFYDTMTLPLGIVMVLLIGYSLYSQWGLGELRHALKRSVRAVVISIVASAIMYWLGLQDALLLLFAFTSVFAIVVNLELAWNTRMGGLRVLGGKLAHIGLGIFFLGVISTGKYSTERDLALQFNVPQEAMGYTFTYVGNRQREDGKYAFDVMVEKDGTREALSPVMFSNGEQGVMRNPDISASFMKDIYLSPVSLNQPDAQDHTHAHESYTLPKGESVSMGGVQARFVRFDMGEHGSETTMGGPDGMTIGSVLELSNGSANETIVPVAVYKPNSAPTYTPITSRLMNANVQLVGMNVGMGGGGSTVTVEVQRDDDAHAHGETLVVQASVKPFVSLLWIGTVIMFGGVVLSIIRRAKE